MIAELVTADRLRPGDVLITTEGPLQLGQVQSRAERVWLCSRFERGTYVGPSRWWSVPTTTTFRRFVRSGGER